MGLCPRLCPGERGRELRVVVVLLLLGVQPPEPKDTGPDTNSPLRKLKLKGIWDQTGSRLAVINREVYRQGDEIDGYKIIEIGSDEVWFQGPRNKERLGLEKSLPRTNAYPRIAIPPSHQ